MTDGRLEMGLLSHQDVKTTDLYAGFFYIIIGTMDLFLSFMLIWFMLFHIFKYCTKVLSMFVSMLTFWHTVLNKCL